MRSWNQRNLLEWRGLRLNYKAIDQNIELHSTGVKHWYLRLDNVTKSDPALMPRLEYVNTNHEYLFVTTNGEHVRGASYHHQQIHCISHDGIRKWGFDSDVLSTIFQTKQGWVFLALKEKSAPVSVVVLDKNNGQVLHCWPVPCTSPKENYNISPLKIKLVPRKRKGFYLRLIHQYGEEKIELPWPLENIRD